MITSQAGELIVHTILSTVAMLCMTALAISGNIGGDVAALGVLGAAGIGASDLKGILQKPQTTIINAAPQV